MLSWEYRDHAFLVFRECSPSPQLGKLGPYHLATPALSEHYTATSSSARVILENPHESSVRPIIWEMTAKACRKRRDESLQPQLLFSPPLHGEQDGNEALALLRQCVLDARWHLAEVGAHEETIIHELLELF